VHGSRKTNGTAISCALLKVKSLGTNRIGEERDAPRATGNGRASKLRGGSSCLYRFWQLLSRRFY